MEEGKEELERLKLVAEIPDDLNPKFKKRLEANAFNVLTCLLNVVAENVSYFATFEARGKAVSKAGMFRLRLGTYVTARVLKTLTTDIQSVYGDAKNELLKSLVRFDKSLLDAALLLLKRVDDNVGALLSDRQGLTQNSFVG